MVITTRHEASYSVMTDHIWSSRRDMQVMCAASCRAMTVIMTPPNIVPRCVVSARFSSERLSSCTAHRLSKVPCRLAFQLLI